MFPQADAVRAAAPHSAIQHQPALDGLRGAAVLGVLLFHGGVTWAAGGYLGVSAFFTLSGFLITSVTLARRSSSGRIDLGDFWRRRARRLLPAAWLCLAGVAVYGLTVAPDSALDTLPGDIVAGLAYVANWRLIATGSSYEAMFSAPSPVTHLWSLGIEEQFYLLFPLVAAAVLARGRSPRVLGAVLAAGAAASAVTMALVHQPGGSTARAYYGTDARAAEILVGAVAAVVWWELRQRRPDVRRLHPAVTAAGAAAALCALVAWATVRSSSSWLYQGGFLVHAVAVSLLIVAVHHPGPLRTALSVAPLRWLGLISYGVYLYHWPLFLVIDESRTGWDGPLLLGVRLAVTLVVATASYVLVEEPVRRGRVRIDGRVALGAGLAVVMLAVAVHASRPMDAGTAFASPPAASPLPQVSGGDTSAPDGAEGVASDRAPRVALFGDSTSLMLSMGVAAWVDDAGALDWGGTVTPLGCGLGRRGERDVLGIRGEIECDDWSLTWPAWNREQQTDISVVLVGPWEVVDRRIEGDDRWRAPGDPVYDDFLRTEIREALTVLTETSDTVIWLTHPPIEPGREIVPRPSRPFPEADPARMERMNQLIVEEVDRWAGGQVHVVDLAAYFDQLPAGPMDETFRPDGIHLTVESATEVAEWLGPRIIEIHAGAQ